MQSEAEVKAHVVMKAAEDDDFRARFIADPCAAAEEVLGMRFPENYQLHVHQESATDAHLVLPPNPGLSREQLDHIAGSAGGVGRCGWGPCW